MPSNQSSHTLAVSDAAQAVCVTVHSLRRWCEWHAAHLSLGANPTPGEARRLTGVDIEVLRHVKALRDEGLQTIAINDKLSGLTFAEIDTPANANIAIVDAPDKPDRAPGTIVGQDYMMSIERRFEALQASVNEVRQAPVTSQRDGVLMFGVGFIAALLFVVVIIGLAVLYGGFK